MRMRYEGPNRTVLRGGRSYDLEDGETFDAHPADRSALEEVGASVVDDDTRALSDRTVDELRDLAAEAEIEGRSSMTKGELVAALEQEG